MPDIPSSWLCVFACDPESLKTPVDNVVLAHQPAEAMKARNLTKVAMARRMNTSRSQLDRLVDPENQSVSLDTLTRAAAAVGLQIRLEIV